MADSAKKSVSVKAVVIDTILTVAVFVFFHTILRKHVPSTDPAMIELWAALTSACMTGVFWLSLQMFKLVYRYQKELRKRVR